MRAILKPIYITLMLSISFLAPQASAKTLNGLEIKQKIKGKKIFLSTKYGVEFPLIYRSNGSVTGDGTGTALGKFFAPKETGKWWVSGNRLCQQFKTWYDGKRLCFTLEKTDDKNLIWRQENGDSGKARIAN